MILKLFYYLNIILELLIYIIDVMNFQSLYCDSL